MKERKEENDNIMKHRGKIEEVRRDSRKRE
jgi:hypothetical protein